MRRMVEWTAAGTMAVTLALVGCTDASIVTVSDPEPAFFTQEPAPGYAVMRRDAPLATDLTVTRTIGKHGGRLDLAAAGIHVVIPKGALDGPTDITLTARAGTALAYELSPVTLELRAPAQIHVDLAVTNRFDTLSGLSDGTPLPDVLGVHYEPHEGGAEPVRNLRAIKVDGAIVVETMTLLAGYATASG